MWQRVLDKLFTIPLEISQLIPRQTPVSPTQINPCDYVGIHSICSVGNGSGLPSYRPGWNQLWSPSLVQKLRRNPNRLTSAGLSPRLGTNTLVFGQIGTTLQFHFMVPSFLGHLWPQISNWVLIVSWHDQYLNWSILCARSSYGFKFAIQPIFVASVLNNAEFQVKFTGSRSQII
jgi:hypothetical protein